MRKAPLRKAHCRSCYGKSGHIRGSRGCHSHRTHARSCCRTLVLEVLPAGEPLARSSEREVAAAVVGLCLPRANVRQLAQPRQQVQSQWQARCQWRRMMSHLCHRRRLRSHCHPRGTPGSVCRASVVGSPLPQSKEAAHWSLSEDASSAATAETSARKAARQCHECDRAALARPVRVL